MRETMQKPKKRYLVLKIIGGVLLILLLVVAVIGWQFRSYVFAAWDATQYSTEEIEDKMRENETRIAKALEEIPEIQVRDLTDEEKQQLESGELTEEQAIELLTGGASAANAAQPDASEQDAAQTSDSGSSTANTGTSASQKPASAKPSASKPDYSAQISAEVARAYVLRNRFTGKLDSLLEQAKTDYSTIPDKARTTDRKTEFIEKYMGIANDMEASCDASMSELVGNVRRMLKASGQSTSLADEIASTYDSEKQLKKSYYMSLYQ